MSKEEKNSIIEELTSQFLATIEGLDTFKARQKKDLVSGFKNGARAMAERLSK